MDIKTSSLEDFSKYFVYLYDTPEDTMKNQLTFHEYIDAFNEYIDVDSKNKITGKNKITDLGSEDFYNLLNKIVQTIKSQKGGKSDILEKLKKHNFI